ncbi:MAG: hypothetical protein HN849_13855 [Victivallales bacterium]|nr:hypothetical protein [Victivallales bacterium]
MRVCLSLCLLSIATIAAPTAPCTLYKEADITNARANLVQHKWAAKVVAGWRGRVAYVMGQDREFIERMIPTLTPWSTYVNNCPECVGKKSSMGEVGIYRWDVKQPDQLVCKYCKTVYPSEKYPENSKVVCPKMGQTFSIYRNPQELAHPENTGKYAYRWASWPASTSWSGLLRERRGWYCMSKALTLAKLCVIEGDLKAGERAVWIMDRTARCFPNWLYHTYNGTIADCPPAEAAAELGRHPRAGKFAKDVIVNSHGLHQYKNYARLCVGFWGAGRFGTGTSEDSFLLDYAVAYDLLRGVKKADGQPLMAAAEKKRIEELLLQGLADRENWNEINNKIGPNRALSATMGILFDRPQSVRRALNGFEQLLDRCFHFDGFCRESPSYSSMHLGLMANVPLILRGYSDPAGFDPGKGKLLKDFDPFEEVPRYRLALESMVRLAAPGMRYPIIGDTHYKGRVSSRWVETLACGYGERYAGLLETLQGAPLTEKGSEYSLWYRPAGLRSTGEAKIPLQSEWFPGWQVGALRTPEPFGGTALYLNGNAYHGHRHDDTLGVSLYAYGQELASDRGYIWDDPRNAWTKSTESHNLVTVDGKSQQRKGRTSTLQLFAATPEIEVIRATSNAYTQCSVYERTTALVPLAAGGSYVVDVFRVKGGKRHAYGIQSNGELIDTKGVELAALERKHKWLKGFRGGVPQGQSFARWQDKKTFLDFHLLSVPQQFVIADAPGWRSDKGPERNAPRIQQVFADNRAAETESLYVSVWVPHQGTSPVTEAALLGTTPDGACAVRVRLGDREDILAFAPDAAPHTFGPLEVAARVGFLSRSEGKQSAVLIGGTLLRGSGTEVTAPVDITELPVAKTGPTWYELPAGSAGSASLEGQYILAAGTGFEVAKVAGQRLILRDYPAKPAKILRVLSLARLAQTD